jgi:hypothetical protein
LAQQGRPHTYSSISAPCNKKKVIEKAAAKQKKLFSKRKVFFSRHEQTVRPVIETL